jgi:hypothetical protein
MFVKQHFCITNAARSPYTSWPQNSTVKKKKTLLQSRHNYSLVNNYEHGNGVQF